jgi:glycerol-3-phosphate dehydrogenase
VLVFPTVDGKVIAGPTAVDGEDKGNWTVRPEAKPEVMAKACAMWPPIEGAAPIASYAGLRPAGRDGANYWIAHSGACPGLVNVAAIRSTGLTASLGIGEYVVALLAEHGLELGPERPLPPGRVPGNRELPWWRRAGQLAAT